MLPEPYGSGIFICMSFARLACLVAHHSEARLRGLTHTLDEFPRERSATADVLTYCDLTRGPPGERVSL